LDNTVAVDRPMGGDLQNQHVEGSLQELGVLTRYSCRRRRQVVDTVP
jgi:hypothetical protein